MSFSEHLAAMDIAIDLDLRDPAWLRPLSGEADIAIRVALERPEQVEVLGVAGIVRERPWVEMSLRLVPILCRGDLVLIGSAAPWDGWKIAATPTRPGDGRHWRAEVEPIGAVPE